MNRTPTGRKSFKVIPSDSSNTSLTLEVFKNAKLDKSKVDETKKFYRLSPPTATQKKFDYQTIQKKII